MKGTVDKADRRNDPGQKPSSIFEIKLRKWTENCWNYVCVYHNSHIYDPCIYMHLYIHIWMHVFHTHSRTLYDHDLQHWSKLKLLHSAYCLLLFLSFFLLEIKLNSGEKSSYANYRSSPLPTLLQIQYPSTMASSGEDHLVWLPLTLCPYIQKAHFPHNEKKKN